MRRLRRIGGTRSDITSPPSECGLPCPRTEWTLDFVLMLPPLTRRTIQIGPDPKGDKIKVFVRTDRSSTETDTQPSAEGAGKGGWWSLNPSAFLPNGDIRPTYSSKSIGKKRKAPPTADPAQKPGGAALPKTPGSTPGSASTGTVMWTPELTLPSRLSDPFVKKRDESDEFGVVPLPPGKKMRLDEALRDERYDVMQ